MNHPRENGHRGKMTSRPLRKKFARGHENPYKDAQGGKNFRFGKDSKYFHSSAKTFKNARSDFTSRTKIPGHFQKDDERMRTNVFEEQNVGRRDPSKRTVEVHSEAQDLYFRKAMETVKEGISGEDLEMLISNVLDQTEGQELQLSCQSSSSYCIQFLLDSCDDLSVIIRFMKAFEADKAQCCGNMYASHITETLIYHAVKNLKNWSNDINPTEDDKKSIEKAENVSAVISWLYELSEFCLENLTVFLEDHYACYVIRHLIQALGGCYVNEDATKSKRAKEWKKGLKQRYLGEEYVQKPKSDIILDVLPKKFIISLKKLAKAFRKLDDLKAYSAEARIIPILCSLLDMLKKNLPKKCIRLSSFLTGLLFEDVDSKGVPLVLLDKSCSYLVPKLFETANAENQSLIWDNYISSHLEILILHPVGNFSLQGLINVLESGSQLEIMYSSIAQHFAAVVKSQHFGVFVSLASACLRLKSHQAQITKDLMQCFGCDGDDAKQEYLVPVLLGFQSLDTYLERRSSSPESYMQIVLQGSLVVQSLLKFHKPSKVVRSLLSMKPEEIKYLACHMQGCHVLNCFLSCENVGEKNKLKFISLLKMILIPLVCDRNGSLTLCRIWVLMTIKQKSIIAQELSEREHEIRNNQCAYSVYKKFGVHLYRNRYEQWKNYLENPYKRKSSEYS